MPAIVDQETGLMSAFVQIFRTPAFESLPQAEAAACRGPDSGQIPRKPGLGALAGVAAGCIDFVLSHKGSSQSYRM